MYALTGVFVGNKRLIGLREVRVTNDIPYQFQIKIYGSVSSYSLDNLSIQLLNMETNTLGMITGTELYDNFWFTRFFQEYESECDYKLALVFSPLLLVLDRYVDWDQVEDNNIWFWYVLVQLCNDLQNLKYKVGRKWLKLWSTEENLDMIFKGNKDALSRDLLKCQMIYGKDIHWRV